LVIDQKLTFEMIWRVMNDMKEFPDIAALVSDMSELSDLFDGITVEHSSNDVTLADDGKTSQITSTVVSNVTSEAFMKIKNQLIFLRQNITKI